jgi:hypothetical protein
MGSCRKDLQAVRLHCPCTHDPDHEAPQGTNLFSSIRLYSIVTDITRLMSDGYGWVDFSVESSTKNNNTGKKVVRSII